MHRCELIRVWETGGKQEGQLAVSSSRHSLLQRAKRSPLGLSRVGDEAAARKVTLQVMLLTAKGLPVCRPDRTGKQTRALGQWNARKSAK